MNQIIEYITYDPSRPLLFNSGLFLVLFIMFSGIFLLLEKKRTLRVVWTLVFSLFFYYKSSGFYFWILILSTAIDYFLGFAIHNASDKVRRRFFLILSLISNLGILAYFKYTNFIIGTFNDFGANFEFADIFLPVGISFYTFQTLSYSLDIYRGKLKPERNILDFAFFVSFFPQLVAGPIVRAAEFLPQIRAKLELTNADFGKAVFLIGSGLFKKAVISDYISVNFVDRVFDNPTLYTGFENLMAIYAYAIQIYCDFSGYSDIAIGLALLLGFRLPINFDSPYQSASITEFWRRWHISLSSWLRDYLYISLGGNRLGLVRTYVNLIVTMLLGGLWHGASWKFVFWGAMHGIMLAIEKFINSVVEIPKNKLTRVLGIIFTFHFVCFCWFFFRADSFATAIQMISRIYSNFGWAVVPQFASAYPYIILLLIIGYLLHFTPKNIELKVESVIVKFPLLVKSLYIAVIAWIAVQVASSEIVPFIYFQF